jgi:hypothetical protein
VLGRTGDGLEAEDMLQWPYSPGAGIDRLSFVLMPNQQMVHRMHVANRLINPVNARKV